ncbi:MAG: redoxin domain-containing protein [Anaerolineales bacterium]|nr:redoxin domain-containing protein [Anaerolineales bacterium]
MVTRLLRGGHHVVGYEIDETAIRSLEKDGVEGARTMAELAGKVEAPRSIWMMLLMDGRMSVSGCLYMSGILFNRSSQRRLHVVSMISGRRKFQEWQARYDSQAPKIGDLAPDFELYDVQGANPVRLSDFRGNKPVVLVFGSFT